MSRAGTCAIAGIANTPYTRGTDKSTLDLHLEASLAALADAGLTPADVDGVLPSASAGRTAEDFILNLGLRDLAFAPTAHMGGASLISSIQNACLAIDAGVASCVLVPAGRRGYSGERISAGRGVMEPIMSTLVEFEAPYGNVGAAQWFAQAAQRHMHEYGTTSEQLGHVAVTCRAHANLNPQALMYGKPMTLADHQASRMITTPFRLLDCSLESDGAGALVITSADRARSLGRGDALIAGVGEAHSSAPTSITQKPDVAVVRSLQVAAARAFAMAGITVAEADTVLIHEGFSWYVIAALEALGVVKPGEGGPFVADGNIRLGGPLPVNPHGGALSEGHVSGVNHVIEGVRQLRRTVEPARQVPDCATVVVVNEGNFFDGTVLVLEKGQ
ncbi:acetyl-CoA acetyltransferase [Streptosporangium sp. NBC_01755]|uniref:thiolase C-terminal domain-containing protein n=1 Tax=unclassified Streptosporangium TaxID=2632669 RepID=UPI002DD80347|nr:MULTISPECIES: acetyl-CoA acetyltransferase [unclassified Streptosporangium]WSA24624.1 acetyl-CoA acetyltransferase [Streptosporangium sp. NBC_01810]WSC97300.1 acetyl-CoA acetyltransferase [Streptosporangium sp. NBC_01755]